MMRSKQEYLPIKTMDSSKRCLIRPTRLKICMRLCVPTLLSQMSRMNNSRTARIGRVSSQSPASCRSARPMWPTKKRTISLCSRSTRRWPSTPRASSLARDKLVISRVHSATLSNTSDSTFSTRTSLSWSDTRTQFASSLFRRTSTWTCRALQMGMTCVLP